MLNGKEGRLLRRNNDKDTNMKINILLCDDDKDFLQRISDTVVSQPVPPGASICITKSSNPAEITDRQLSQYHIMFLDIDMDERSGMDIARRVRELHLDTVIVFVTNYPEFSMEGYEVRAFRYLLKQELEQKHNLERIYAQGLIEDSQYLERKALIEQQLFEKKEFLTRKPLAGNIDRLLKNTRLIKRLFGTCQPLMYFDKQVFTSLVSKVTISDTSFEFELINGMRVSERRTSK